MSRTMLSLTIVGAALLAGTGGLAGEFIRIDADGDGKITEKEILAEAKRVFLWMDKDGSGDVSAGDR